MTTGMDLKLSRVAAKLRQRQIAEQSGLSRSWVAKVEGQDSPDPKAVETYRAALRTFGVVSDGQGDQ